MPPEYCRSSISRGGSAILGGLELCCEIAVVSVPECGLRWLLSRAPPVTELSFVEPKIQYRSMVLIDKKCNGHIQDLNPRYLRPKVQRRRLQDKGVLSPRNKSTTQTISREGYTMGVEHRQEEQPTTSLPFQTVIIEGGSHARHLAGLVQQRVKLPTRVSGICKPSAGLLDATSGAPPTPGSCCVILAGTNDIATGESQSIYRHLEQRIIARLASSRVIVSTIPQRHDLPVDHIVNQTTTAVNHYIEKLCARCEGAQLLNINSIERRWFTRHGLHLRLSGKRILAGLLVRSLVEVGRLPFSKSPPSPIKYNPESTSPNKLQSSPISTPFQSTSSLSPIQVPSLDTPCTDNTPHHPIVRPGNFDTYADAVAGNFTERENENGRFPNQKNSIVDTCLKKG
ncbi:hypothetical protein J6590_018957 [Homalodisca vitripennis]|nr:hypothetical protein J6590_018957 [Homalodisca vitripennis]